MSFNQRRSNLPNRQIQRNSHRKMIQNYMKMLENKFKRPTIPIKSQIQHQQLSDSEDDYYDDQIYGSSSQDDQYYQKKRQNKKVNAIDVLQLPQGKIKTLQQGSCSVCLVDWKIGQAAKLLPCAHKYHHQCIRDWLITKNFCPLCKKCVF